LLTLKLKHIISVCNSFLFFLLCLPFTCYICDFLYYSFLFTW